MKQLFLKLLYSPRLRCLALACALTGALASTLTATSGRPGNAATPVEDPLTKAIKLPPGFSISVFARGMECPRQMALAPDGTIYVGTKINRNGKLYAVIDRNKDGVADKVIKLAEGLKCPNGVAYHQGDLYVAEINRILRYDKIDSQLKAIEAGTKTLTPPVVVSDKFPSDGHHGWKYIRFGPDGKLYVPVGAPCNICEPPAKIYASLNRMNKDGSNLENFASGIRNTVGFDWHPVTRQLWFTDNGRDLLGDNLPPDELNCAAQAGMHFGYPYRYGDNVSDPLLGNRAPQGLTFTPPVAQLGAHVAALGMRFYTGKMFPPAYKHNVFIAEHGSWNRSSKSGCRVSRVIPDGKNTKYEPFASGWLNEARQEYSGRPVDIVVAADGALLVSDDLAGVIYRIAYKQK